jgi:hypothetical protein
MGSVTTPLFIMKNKKNLKELLYQYGVIYFGTSLMMFSPFVIDSWVGKMGMVFGLILITVQTQVTKQYNLSILNLVGICGYLYSLITSLT